MVWEISFYENKDGDSPIGEFLANLSEKARAKCLSYIEQLEQRGKTLQAFPNIRKSSQTIKNTKYGS